VVEGVVEVVVEEEEGWMIRRNTGPVH